MNFVFFLFFRDSFYAFLDPDPDPDTQTDLMNFYKDILECIKIVV